MWGEDAGDFSPHLSLSSHIDQFPVIILKIGWKVFLICELKEGTFLVLEIAREYENNGNWIRVQGKYLPVIRRHILGDYGLLSEDNGYFQRL